MDNWWYSALIESTNEGAMTLAALLTVFSITLAIFSLARPVGRRSLSLFVPAWRMVAAICLSLICIIVRDAPFGVKPPFHWRLDLVEFGLNLGAFIAPVGIALWCLDDIVSSQTNQ
jgi:hypothetical protein